VKLSDDNDLIKIVPYDESCFVRDISDFKYFYNLFKISFNSESLMFTCES